LTKTASLNKLNIKGRVRHRGEGKRGRIGRKVKRKCTLWTKCYFNGIGRGGKGEKKKQSETPCGTSLEKRGLPVGKGRDITGGEGEPLEVGRNGSIADMSIKIHPASFGRRGEKSIRKLKEGKAENLVKKPSVDEFTGTMIFGKKDRKTVDFEVATGLKGGL